MKKVLRTIFFYKNHILISILGILFLLTGFTQSRREVNLNVRNDYSFDVIVKTKCGSWIEKEKRFEYEKDFVFKSETTTTLTVPNYYDNCQVWTSHKW